MTKYIKCVLLLEAVALGAVLLGAGGLFAVIGAALTITGKWDSAMWEGALVVLAAIAAMLLGGSTLFWSWSKLVENVRTVWADR